MATIMTVAEAKTHLSRLIAEAEAGGEVVIARGNTPVVRMVPVAPKRTPVFGALKGRVAFSESFWDPLPAEELRLWNGGGD